MMQQSPTVVRQIPWTAPVVAADRLRKWSGLTFFDSATHHGTLGRYSYVTADPFAELIVEDGEVIWNGVRVRESPLDALAKRLEHFAQPDLPELPPFQAGAAGYFSY